MTKHVLFIQGAGEGAFEEDKKLAASLKKALGTDYEIHYPTMLDEDNASYERWKQQIEKELTVMQGSIILVGHSVGASIVIKWLSEAEVKKPIAGIFLIAAPFWGGNGWRYEGYEELALPKGFAAKLPKGTSIFLYQSRDDETVPFEHLALYAQVLPQATARELDAGGHQLNNDLSEVARDIKTLGKG
ncbi:MAG: alpha/beta hydrolase [Anaerolineae bacterium]|nr:alpha/beta hydrolase [Anaerolineae bacterium]